MQNTETATFSDRCTCNNCGCAQLKELSTGQFDQGAVQRFIAEDPWGEHPAPFLRGKSWSFVECQDCGFTFHRYILSPEWNERRFSKWMSQEAIEAFEKPFNTPANAFRKAVSYTDHVLSIERLTRELRDSAAPRVLDFGCGYGRFLSMCSMYGFESYGVDRAAAKRENGIFDNVFANIDDVSDFAPFHALTLFEVLEHLDDPRGILLRLRDMVVTGGILILETPDCTGVNRIETRYDYSKIHPLEHINGFTPKSLKDFATRLGFEQIWKPISCITSDSKDILKSVVKRGLAPLMKSRTQMYFKKV